MQHICLMSLRWYFVMTYTVGTSFLNDAEKYAMHACKFYSVTWVFSSLHMLLHGNIMCILSCMYSKMLYILFPVDGGFFSFILTQLSCGTGKMYLKYCMTITGLASISQNNVNIENKISWSRQTENYFPSWRERQVKCVNTWVLYICVCTQSRK